jgi:hypothetical protein
MRAFALAGAAAGLAGAHKYNGILAVVMPLLACALTPRAARLARGVFARDRRARWSVPFSSPRPYTILDLRRS